MTTEILLTDQSFHQMDPHMLTNEIVALNHQSLLNNGKNVQKDLENVIKILGGIDTILQIHLHQQQLPSLSTDQLQQLNNILLSIDNNNTKLQSSQTSVLIASTSETLLHRIFKLQTALKIMDILFSKYMTCLIGILWIIWIIDWSLLTYAPSTQTKTTSLSYIWPWIFVPIFMPYATLVCLSMNMSIAKQILLTFEFWFKLLYYVRFWVCHILTVVMYQENFTFIYVLNQQFQHLSFFLFVTIYGVVDGLNISFGYKVIVLTLGSVYATAAAIFHTFRTFDNDVYKTFVIFGQQYTADLNAFMGSSWRILAIFMWKQTILSMYKPDVATSLFKSVKIVWS